MSLVEAAGLQDSSGGESSAVDLKVGRLREKTLQVTSESKNYSDRNNQVHFL